MVSQTTKWKFEGHLDLVQKLKEILFMISSRNLRSSKIIFIRGDVGVGKSAFLRHLFQNKDNFSFSTSSEKKL